MALVLKDRVKETTTTTGTGTITLAGAVSGFQSFSTIGNANTTYYAIIGDTEWEIGIGTYTSSGTTLSRDTVLASSNSGSLVSFSAGTKTVFCDYPATKSVSTDSLATPPAIGGTTPAAGTFTTLIGGGGSANYGQLTGGATTKAVEFKTIGSDTNVGLAIRSQGTGAIDLAAGSSGVNISNGGTVTAITRTASGGPSYTTVPSVTLSAPTTSGGVQATASVTMFISTATVSAGGSGYLVGDVLTISGGTGTGGTLTVATLSGSAVATVTITNAGIFTALPSNPVSVTGGTGTGATFTLGWGVNTIVVGNAGSGYVEQPTVTFSSGSATAYATVGSIPTFKSVGSALSFATSSGELFRIIDGSQTTTQTYLSLESSTTGSVFRAQSGVNSNSSLSFVTKGTSSLTFATAGTTTNTQLQVSHTASAVNYVQVTGNATTVRPRIDFTGSDTNVGGAFVAKGSGAFVFASDANASTIQFSISRTGSAVNYLQVTGAASGSSPTISSQGSGTDLDINLTPKGTGVLSFGTYTASVLSVTGYISIKDSGGTTRRLLVG
jgi:hypothetical protein